MADKEYDLFISYASEDKGIVRSLTEALSKFGLSIWLDELVLDIGDNISEAIDAGLLKSRYGLIVLSQAFMRKRRGWPGYELRGLNAREIGSSKVILPIWHGVSREDVIAFSPAFADKVALDTSKQGAQEIALRIFKAVRPEAFEHLYRYMMFREQSSKGEIKLTPLSELRISPIRHKTLPDSLLLRARLVHEVLSEVVGSLDDLVNNFRRDLYPADEVGVWERIAVAYLAYTKGKNISIQEKEKIFGDLLSISIQTRESLQALLEEEGRTDREFWQLVVLYANAIPKISERTDGSEKEELLK